jgi:hypothetical protein
MATLHSVPEADRADFIGRLALFNIDPSSFLADDLTTAASTITTLSLAPRVASRFQPIIPCLRFARSDLTSLITISSPHQLLAPRKRVGCVV